MIIKNDLRHLFLPVRDQGPRPTCFAFATSALHESFLMKKNYLSSEYLFLKTLERFELVEDDGLTYRQVEETLRIVGQPDENAFPYGSKDLTSLVNPVLHKANLHLIKLSAIDDLLAQNIAVIVILDLKSSFYNAINFIVDSYPDDESQGCHAVVIVGTGVDDRGQKIYLIRNSWGKFWEDDGHVWLTESYLKLNGYQFIELN